MEKGFHSEGHIPEQSQLREMSVPRPEQLLNNKSIAKEWSEAEIKNLAKQVRDVMKEFSELPWPLAQEKAFRKIMGISSAGVFSPREEVLLSAVAKDSRLLAAKRSKDNRERKKMHTVPKGRVFTPAQIARMSAQAQKMEDEDTERAGQPLE
jgi:hypothetical protein